DPERIRASLFFQMFHPVKWMRGLQQAIADGIACVVEFGGGIGKDVPGMEQAPASRKPNLEGITRKAYLAAHRNGLYLPAINLASLVQAARSIQALQRISATPAVAAGDNWIDERLFSLYLPLYGGAGSEVVLELEALLQDMGLSGVVRVIAETHDDSLRTLRACFDADVQDAEPYLEVLVAGTGSFLHYRGEDIRRELGELRERLDQAGYQGLLPRGRSTSPTGMAIAEVADEK
ncbi:MAG: hypothetical protein HGA47_10045, partial [Zoogloea sp.]|nr:hypothetical protein [Zoogloea sp.]